MKDTGTDNKRKCVCQAWRQKRSSSTVKGLTLYVRYRFLTENTSTLSKKASWSVHKSAMIGTLEHVGLHSFSSLTAKKRKTSRGRQLLESRRLNNFSHAHHKNTKYSPRLCSYAGWCEQLYKTVFEENEVVEGSTSVFPTYMDNESRSYNTPRLYARLTWIHPNFDDFDATLRLPMCKQAALLQWGFMFDMVGLVEKNNKKRRRFKQLSSRYNKTTWVSQISQSGQFLKYFICLFQIIFKNNCFLYAILLTEKE